jgi:hypothetical protein
MSWLFHLQPYFLTLQVLTPISVYKGQKLIKLVNANTIATISKINANVPVTTPVK